MSTNPVNYATPLTPEDTFTDSAQLSIRNVSKVFPGKQDVFSKISRQTSPDFVALQ